MIKGKPVCNKILKKKWEKKEDEMYKTRLTHVKSHFELIEPPKHDHVKRKAKKEVILEEKYSEIERANQVLLSKLTKIMNSPSETFMR